MTMRQCGIAPVIDACVIPTLEDQALLVSLFVISPASSRVRFHEDVHTTTLTFKNALR